MVPNVQKTISLMIFGCWLYKWIPAFFQMEIKTQPKSEKRSQFVPSGSGHFWGVDRQILLLPPPQPSPPQIHSIQTELLCQPGTICVPMVTPFLVVTWQLDPSITRWSNSYDVATWSTHLPGGMSSASPPVQAPMSLWFILRTQPIQVNRMSK